MLLFGGEFCDGETTIVYNEVFRWNIERNEWKLIESLNTPPPRCSHQAVFFKDQIFIFGGEYATLDQFHHYRDMWALDIRSNVWREIPMKGDGPSPRSGHRMVAWRNYLVLFGGFYEALKEVRWFNDLFLFSFQEERWIQIPRKPTRPSRSFTLLASLASPPSETVYADSQAKERFLDDAPPCRCSSLQLQPRLI
jgi:N-acetylneuraminic acid mutarotase